VNPKLTGVFAPIITPFTNQKVDLKKLEWNIQKLNQSRLRGYMPLGSNGEFVHMNDDEQLGVYRTVKNNSAGDKVLIAGIARQSAYCTVEFGKKIVQIGADFVSVLCPSYFASSMNDAALIRYYIEVADSLEIPVLMYNCPKFAAGVTISENVVKILSEHPNILGIKDTSANNIETYLAVKNENFEVLAGSINIFLKGLKAGASGGVLSPANYLPDQCCMIQTLYMEGKHAEAEELYNRFAGLIRESAGKYGTAGVKAACDLLGFNGGEVRNPLMDCTPEQKEQIGNALKSAGYLSEVNNI